YLYRTRDGGRTWTLIVDGIRNGDFANAVREDPRQRGLLYAATELGAYVSFTDGDHWQPLQMNLPSTSVRDIDVHGDDVVIATHGRGFWVLDDVSSLRQIAMETSHDSTRLFAPAVAIRVRPAGFTGTPLPKDEPTAVNPAFGARLDYRLAATPKQPVQLAIFNDAGQLVRRYSSADVPPAYEPDTAGIAPEWFTAPSVLATTPGLHRFVWPLHYAALPASSGGNAFADGVLAPPGRYVVELTVDGTSFKQPLTVVADPRVHLAPSAFAQQFELARAVEAAQERLASAQVAASQLHDAIRAARKSPATGTDDPLRTLDAKVVDIAGIVDVSNPGNAGLLPPDNTHSFAFLAQALGKLANATDDADAAPSVDARNGYRTLVALLDPTLAQWQQLLASDLPAVNAGLRRAGRPELTLVPPGHKPEP
ncbi:MAG: hypothetical protein JWL98_1529, partial [Xanthomonadaceae bacterium]|nr:hypothetical protein [Xanthomonadaceae bacterium]